MTASSIAIILAIITSTTTTYHRHDCRMLYASAASLRATSLVVSSDEDAIVATATGGIGGRRRRTTTATTSKTKAKTNLPLIGIGVGNLPHGRVPYVLAMALDAGSGGGGGEGGRGRGGKSSTGPMMKYRLIDTSHGHTDSTLEVLVGRSLSRILTSSTTSSAGATGGGNDENVYHVMIKVWHTHLGYERTMMSVRNSLSDVVPGRRDGDASPNAAMSGGGGRHTNNNGLDVRVYAILQYPRCHDGIFSSTSYVNSPNFPIKYDNCADEEDGLDEIVKDASENGISPLMDKDGAWKRSYRALEELYHRGILDGIGVGDFGPSDVYQLFNIANVGPHVYQGTLRTLFTQEELVEDLVRHGVQYQCHDVASTILGGKDDAPRAYARLERIGAKHVGLTTTDEGENNNDEDDDGGTNFDYVDGYSPIQVVLGYLVHHRGVGVVPGTTDASHLAENSPMSLGAMRRFGPREVLDIETAVMALMNGKDDVDSDGTMGVGSMEGVITASGAVHGVAGDDGDDYVNNYRPNDGEGGGDGVVATFFNALPHPRTVRIFRVHPVTGEQIQLSHGIPPGRSGRMIVDVDDVLIAYDAHGSAVNKFLVERSTGNDGSSNGGGSVDFTVESS
jgi:diketogulonate reductase-like aldo/keto reductase